MIINGFFDASRRPSLLGAGILLSLSLLMAFPRPAGWLLGLIAFGGLIALARTREFNSIDKRFLAFCVVLPASYVWNMMITGWEVDLLERPGHMLAGFLIYYLIGRFGLHRNILFYGALLAAFSALGIALYEGVYLGNQRVFGLGHRWNAVPFGNFSLIVGFFCLAAAGLPPQATTGHPIQRHFHLPLALSGLFAGLTASMITGTRGGWVAIPLLLFPWMLLNDRLSRKTRAATMIVILGMVIAFFSTSERIHSRLDEAREQIVNFVAAPDSLESKVAPVGTRLGMWYWGVTKFLQHPFTGIGFSAYEQERKAAVAAGELPAEFLGLANLHNELITSLALGGLPSALAVIAFWILGWRFFHAGLNTGNQDERYFALCGLLTLVGTGVFSMTEGLFGTSPGTKALVLCLAIPAGALRYADRKRTISTNSGVSSQGSVQL